MVDEKLVSQHFERPWNGQDVITGKTMGGFIELVNSPGVEARVPAKLAAIAICRAYGINGVCDPGYIANVIESQLSRFNLRYTVR